MRTREELLEDLVSFSGNLSKLSEELSEFPWDSDPIKRITVQEVKNALNLALEGSVTIVRLVEWANLIECREDLESENSYIDEIIYELANPEINGELSKDSINSFLKNLTRSDLE